MLIRDSCVICLKMSRLLITISLSIISIQAFGCKCAFVSINEEIQRSDLVFSGKVTKKERTNGYYSFTFATIKTWKGAENNINVIVTDESSISCGADFKLAEEYIIFSTNGRTDKCRGNELVRNSYVIGIVNFSCDSAFKNSVGVNDSGILNQPEAEYFNSIFSPIVKDTFDFTDKKVAFVETGTLTNKKRYFETWGDQETVSQLILLTVNEKQESGGYDAIIVSWRKAGVNKRFRRQLIGRLGQNARTPNNGHVP